LLEKNRRLLEEYGLELVYDYGFWPNEKEEKVLRDFLKTIETDFLGFGNHYAVALKYIKEDLPDVKTIVDIGCAWGLQSYMFKDYDYIGLDAYAVREEKDFCKFYNHHRFVKGLFPFVCPTGDAFISSMSIGYDLSVFRNRNEAEVKEAMRKRFGEFRYGFTVTEKWVEELLQKEGFKGRNIGVGVVFWYK